jgi:hypothetical protein
MTLHCVIEILDTATNETAAFEDCTSIWLDSDGYTNDFMWSEGNYSCDCNRQLFFTDALGKPRSDLDKLVCGVTRYLVKATRLDTGETVFDEIN